MSDIPNETPYGLRSVAELEAAEPWVRQLYLVDPETGAAGPVGFPTGMVEPDYLSPFYASSRSNAGMLIKTAGGSEFIPVSSTGRPPVRPVEGSTPGEGGVSTPPVASPGHQTADEPDRYPVGAGSSAPVRFTDRGRRVARALRTAWTWLLIAVAGAVAVWFAWLIGSLIGLWVVLYLL